MVQSVIPVSNPSPAIPAAASTTMAGNASSGSFSSVLGQQQSRNSDSSAAPRATANASAATTAHSAENTVVAPGPKRATTREGGREAKIAATEKASNKDTTVDKTPTKEEGVSEADSDLSQTAKAEASAQDNQDKEKSGEPAQTDADSTSDDAATLLPAQAWLAHLQTSQAARERLQGETLTATDGKAHNESGEPGTAITKANDSAKSAVLTAVANGTAATGTATPADANAATHADANATTHADAHTATSASAQSAEAAKMTAYHAAQPSQSKRTGETQHSATSTAAVTGDRTDAASSSTASADPAMTKNALLAESGHTTAHQMVWSTAVHALKSAESDSTGASSTPAQDTATPTLTEAAQAAASKGMGAELGQREGGHQPSSTDLTASLGATHSAQQAASLTPGAHPTPAGMNATATGNAAQAASTLTNSSQVLPGTLQLTPLSQGVQALAEHVTLMMGQKLQQAEIQLDPQGLGKMTVQLSMEREQASVHFVVQHAQTRELLEQALPRLRDMLSGQGIQLSQGSVQQQSQDPTGQQAWGQAQAGQQGQSGQGGSYRGQSGTAGGEESARSDGQNFGIRSTSATGIDFYA